MSLDKVIPLLINLPYELQELILNEFSWRDVLHFRLVCQDLFQMVQAHGDGIAQNLVRYDKTVSEAYSLFSDDIAATPTTTTTPPLTFELIFDLLHQQSIVDHLAHKVAMHQYTQLSHNRGGNARAQETYTRQLNLTIRNLRPHLLIISHMLHSYRSALATLVKDVDLTGAQREAVSGIRVRAWRKEIAIMRAYNQDQICHTSLVFELLKKILCSRLRPASYATYVERRARGWTKPPATDAQVVALMVFGGVEGIEKTMHQQTYNKRIDALGDRLSHYTTTTTTTSGTPPTSSQSPPIRQQQPLTINTPFPQQTIDRMLTVLPDRTRFFNLVELGKLVGANDVTSRALAAAAAAQQQPHEYILTDFLKVLREGDMAFEFNLRNLEPRPPEQVVRKERSGLRRADSRVFA